jgi:hypothetical protein
MRHIVFSFAALLGAVGCRGSGWGAGLGAGASLSVPTLLGWFVAANAPSAVCANAVRARIDAHNIGKCFIILFLPRRKATVTQTRWLTTRVAGNGENRAVSGLYAVVPGLAPDRKIAFEQL